MALKTKPSIEGALKQRAALQQEASHLTARIAETRAQEDAAARELHTIDVDIDARAVEAARRGEQLDLRALREQRTEPVDTIADAQRLRALLEPELQSIPSRLGELHREQWDAFATEAQQASARATARLSELETQLREAQGAWAKAQAMWRDALEALDVTDDLRELNASIDGDEYAFTGGAMNTYQRWATAARDLPPWPLADLDELYADGAPDPSPVGWVAPEHRGLHGGPGAYRSVTGYGPTHSTVEPAETARYGLLTHVDRRGFAMWLKETP